MHAIRSQIRGRLVCVGNYKCNCPASHLLSDGGLSHSSHEGRLGEGAGWPAQRSPRTFLGTSSVIGALKGASRSNDLWDRHPGNPDRGG